MTAVRVENLNCGYGQKQILKNISFRIQKAEFFSVIGTNGSGKTTLLKAINRILKINAGTIEVFNQLVSSYSQRHFSRLAAMVTQEMPSKIPFSTRDIVMMGRYPHMGMFGVESERDRKIVKTVMAITDIEHIADSKLNQISGGERQRVFIARALCQEPKIIFLDEPTASLDLSHQVSVMDLMEKLKIEQGITIVMISHDINLAAMYSDRLLLLKCGKIIKSGTPKEVLVNSTLEQAYGCPLVVDKSPLGGYPMVSLVPGRYSNHTQAISKRGNASC